MPERGALVAWTRARFDRVVADDLARRGRVRTAQALRDAVAAEEGEGSGGGLDLLVDWDVYAEAEPALAALISPSSSSTSSSKSDFDRAEPALEWCRKHAARLKKLRSPLPFRLRLQQFVELALRGEGSEGEGGEDETMAPAGLALAHAKKHLAPQALGDSERLSDLQRAMLLLVILGSRRDRGNRKKSEKEEEGVLAGFPAVVRRRFADLLSGERAWRSLATLLRSEVARLHEMGSRSQLSLQVTAGLVALKPPPGAVFDPLLSTISTSAAAAGSPPSSSSASSSRDDPLSSQPLASLAAPLPHARRLHSQLVCGLTGKKMDDANPPAALPCGATFSESARSGSISSPPSRRSSRSPPTQPPPGLRRYHDPGGANPRPPQPAPEAPDRQVRGLFHFHDQKESLRDRCQQRRCHSRAANQWRQIRALLQD